MLPSLFRRTNAFTTALGSPSLLFRVSCFCTESSGIVDNGCDLTRSCNDNEISSGKGAAKFHLSPLFWGKMAPSKGYDIELVDPDTWQVSASLAHAWRVPSGAPERSSVFTEGADEAVNHQPWNEVDPDFDDIEDMRVRGNLFYKLDRDSKEFEEYNLRFLGKKPKDNHKDSKNKVNMNNNAASRHETSQKDKHKQRERTERASSNKCLVSAAEVSKLVKDRYSSLANELGNSLVGKRLRPPTFNQLTEPFHEPFCLDIYVTKGSVRACIVHRVTSKVVAVAHSISKDMKFDLGSTKSVAACAAVGAALAQRALADDIHDVIYMPRKGDKIEGKLQIVLQSIIDNGVNVRVKIKQRKAKKAGHVLATQMH